MRCCDAIGITGGLRVRRPTLDLEELMKKATLYALWAVLFIICALLGFIPAPAGFLRFLSTALSVIFFAPPAMLTYLAAAEGDRNTLKLVRNLSALSLGATLLVLVANVLCAVYSEMLGTVLHVLLTVVSSPMIASGYWAVSLFLWACLLLVTVKQIKRN